MQLKGDFQGFMEGNPNLSAVSSHQIKVKSKSANITGLQFADLLGYPSVRGILQENGRDLGNPPSNATLRFIEAIQPKYVQNGKAFFAVTGLTNKRETLRPPSCASPSD